MRLAGSRPRRRQAIISFKGVDMLPRVFVSSTIEDLHHLRDAVRDAVAELEYIPVMSEYGDVGYLPDRSVEESCLLEMKNSDLAILLVGKRYGEPGSHGLSVTHSEFRTARDNQVPVWAFVDKDVLLLRKVYKANDGSSVSLPGVDDPARLFAFIDEIASYPRNNGFVGYGSVAEVRQQVKRQIAHYIAQLLRDHSSTAVQLGEVLAEVRTLRHEAQQQDKRRDLRPFVSVMKALLSDERIKTFSQVIERTFGDLDLAVSAILTCNSLEDLVGHAGYSVVVLEDLDPFHDTRPLLTAGQYAVRGFEGPTSEISVGSYLLTTDKQLLLNMNAYADFKETLASLKKVAE